MALPLVRKRQPCVLHTSLQHRVVSNQVRFFLFRCRQARLAPPRLRLYFSSVSVCKGQPLLENVSFPVYHFDGGLETLAFVAKTIFT